MKRVVHVVHHFGTGGMENGMVILFNNLPPDVMPGQAGWYTVDV